MNIKHAITLFSTVAIIVLFGLWRLEVAENKRLDAQIEALDLQIAAATTEINQCASDKALSERTSRDYQNNVTALRRQLNSLRKDPACVPTESTPAPDGHHGTPAGGKLPSGNGIRVGYLFDFAGRAEETRLKLEGCQDFVNQLYGSRGLNQ